MYFILNIHNRYRILIRYTSTGPFVSECVIIEIIYAAIMIEQQIILIYEDKLFYTGDQIQSFTKYFQGFYQTGLTDLL